LVRDAAPLLDELLPEEVPQDCVSGLEARLEALAYGDSVPIEAWKTVQVLVEEEPDIAKDITSDMSAQK
jgi:hypothetical protein